MARPARDQLPLRGRADDGRQPRRLQERRQGDRAPERLLDHVHGQAGPHVDRQLVPHPLEPLARRRERFAGESDVFKQFLAGQIALPEELAIFLAPTINSYKRYAAGSWAPTTLAWGHDNRTCGFRIVGHGAVAAGRDAHPGRRRQSRTSPSPRCSRPGSTGSSTSSSCRRRSRGTPTSRTPSASRTRCERRSPRSSRDDGARRLSATTSSTTT